MVFTNPSASGTFGAHFRIFFARVMSGWRCFGSSCGKGLKTISLRELVVRMICLAKLRTVISTGLPMFTGQA